MTDARRDESARTDVDGTIRVPVEPGQSGTVEIWAGRRMRMPWGNMGGEDSGARPGRNLTTASIGNVRAGPASLPLHCYSCSWFDGASPASESMAEMDFR